MCCWKVCWALFLVLMSLSNRAFLNVWLISYTQVCQCWWSVFFGLVLHQHRQMPALYQVFLFCWSVSFGIPFEHMFCQYLHNTLEFKRTCTWIVESCIFPHDKSARQSSSEHFNKGNSCWENTKYKQPKEWELIPEYWLNMCESMSKSVPLQRSESLSLNID